MCFYYLELRERVERGGGGGGGLVKPLGSASVGLARVLATLITLALELYP